ALVVPDHVVGFPTLFAAPVLDRKPGLEIRGPLNLTRHQYAAVHEQAWSPLLEHLDSFVIEVHRSRRRGRDLPAVGENDLALEPGIWVQHQRQSTLSNSRDHPDQTAVMVGVPVRENDGAQLADLEAENIEIVERGLACET